MLSYQHAYHAGNAADVHKHAMLAVALDLLTRKDKPLTYLETHAGRALYDLAGPESAKTGEAKAGIGRMEGWFPADHPLSRALAAARVAAGPTAYPGSPFLATALLRPTDRIVLAERHPQEVAALRAALPRAEIHDTDGPALALALAPPTPRRGIVLVDPSWEVKSDYREMPAFLGRLVRKWPVGIVLLWYPVLVSGAERELVAALDAMGIGGAVRTEVRFPPARPGHGMIGSGLFMVNPPYGWPEAARALARRFAEAPA
jgi:23S rRNA (adenine2030-N6)-methyltransferase